MRSSHRGSSHDSSRKGVTATESGVAARVATTGAEATGAGAVATVGGAMGVAAAESTSTEEAKGALQLYKASSFLFAHNLVTVP